LKEFASVVPLDEEISVEATKIKLERRATGHRDFGLIDGIILATARSTGQSLLTFDPHFLSEGAIVSFSKIFESGKAGAF
jgi:predicted nucleic acid-binding protein